MHPFHDAIDGVVAERLTGRPADAASCRSIPSRPTYKGVRRPWHIGIIHDDDRRLAAAADRGARQTMSVMVGVNEPYSPADRVYYTLERHARSRGLPCAMIEIRNDEIERHRTTEGMGGAPGGHFRRPADRQEKSGDDCIGRPCALTQNSGEGEQQCRHQGIPESDKHEDVKVLHGMGYAQELERRLSRFSNFAISFSIICILSGGINSLRAGDLRRRRHRHRHRLAGRLLRVAGLRRGDGADQLGLSDGRRPLSLGLDPRQSRHRLGDGLAQPARPDHRARRHQCRHLDVLHRRLRRDARHREHHRSRRRSS